MLEFNLKRNSGAGEGAETHGGERALEGAAAEDRPDGGRTADRDRKRGAEN